MMFQVEASNSFFIEMSTLGVETNVIELSRTRYDGEMSFQLALCF